MLEAVIEHQDVGLRELGEQESCSGVSVCTDAEGRDGCAQEDLGLVTSESSRCLRRRRDQEVLCSATTPVATGEDGRVPALLPQAPGEVTGEGSFAGPSDRDATYADNRSA